MALRLSKRIAVVSLFSFSIQIFHHTYALIIKPPLFNAKKQCEHLNPVISSLSSRQGAMPPATCRNSNRKKTVMSSVLGFQDTFLQRYKLVLASQSPRRLEILQLMGLEKGPNVEVMVSTFEETLDKASFAEPGMYAQVNAQCKAQEVAQRLLSSPQQDERSILVLGADTIVELDGEILEKPVNEEDAFQMLSQLSSNEHLVHTGVAVFAGNDASKPLILFHETTKVLFAALSETEIRNYIRTNEPMDKSGSYGIQGYGGQFVEKIEGCYFNVMGLPMHRFSREVAKLLIEAQN